MPDITHVAVAVIENDKGEVCISLRHLASHQGGLWEFPGGKIEDGESVEQALVREIDEELGLDIKGSRPLIKINHIYDDGIQKKAVCLHVCKVLSFEGEASGKEGQQVKWVDITSLNEHDFPVANQGIIKAVSLPDKYLITGKFIDNENFIRKLDAALSSDIKLVQLRLKEDDLQDVNDLQSLVELTSNRCSNAGVKLLLNLPGNYLDLLEVTKIDFSGFHVDSRTLKAITKRPSGLLFSASCHSGKELAKAIQLKADFVVLSPVQKTTSHPDLDALGWEYFSTLVETASIPVFALGGVTEKNITEAWKHGAQGVAAISAFWK